MDRLPPAPAPAWRRATVHGLAFDAITESQLVAHVVAAARRGEGGRIVTPNVDIVRLARRDGAARGFVTRSSLVVADGMPLVWASRIAGSPLPGRVAGADLIWSLSAAASGSGHSVYLLGGATGVPQRAADALCARYGGLAVVGTSSPPYGFDATEESIAPVLADVVRARPDIVFVGLGFPKQERLIDRLAPLLPTAWYVGCGAAIAFAAGAVSRAPRWMQRTGLEWAHRLASEPRRLCRRYLVDDGPFTVRLLGRAAWQRVRRGRHGNGSAAAPPTS